MFRAMVINHWIEEFCNEISLIALGTPSNEIFSRGLHAWFWIFRGQVWRWDGTCDDRKAYEYNSVRRHKPPGRA